MKYTTIGRVTMGAAALQFQEIFEKPTKLVRNISLSQKKINRKGREEVRSRLSIESLPLRAGGLEPGESVRYVPFPEKRAFAIIKDEKGEDTIYTRRRKGKPDAPLVDLSDETIQVLFRARERVDIFVKEGIVLVMPSQSFELLINEPQQPKVGDELKKFRLMSLPAGAGIATAVLKDTGLVECVGGSELLETAASSYSHNFPESFLYFGDIRFQHPLHIPKADIVWLSPPCIEFSSLGKQMLGATEGLSVHFSRIVLESGADILLFEQVPQYYKTSSYKLLKECLLPTYPYWIETSFCSHEKLGSVPTRRRGYAIAATFPLSYPEFPSIKEKSRSTIEQVIGGGWEHRGIWERVDEGVMNYYRTRCTEGTNFGMEHNRMLVQAKEKKIGAFTSSYYNVVPQCSYLVNGDHWRRFTSDETMKLLDIPSWYQFPGEITELQRHRLLGQSVSGQAVRFLGIHACNLLYKNRLLRSFQVAKTNQMIELDDSQPQISFML